MPATKAKPIVSETPPRESKLIRVFPLLFFGGLFLYLGLIVRPTLIYHAFARFIPYPAFSLQMSFLRACLSRPGGLLEYAEGFLSQWFYYSWAGAAILTALAWAAYACTASLLDSSRKVRLRILPYVPALAMIASYSGYHHCLKAILILLCALLATLLYRHASSLRRTGRTLFFFTLACALYYLSGPGCLLLMMLAVVHETFPGRYRLSIILYPLLCAIGVGLVGVVIFGLDEIQAVQLLRPFDNSDVTHVDWLSAQTVILVACLSVPLGLLLERFERKSVKASRQARRRRKARRSQMTGVLGSSRFLLAAKATGLLVGVCLAGWLSYDSTTRHVWLMNYLARQRRWSELLACEPPAHMPYNEYCEHDRIRALCQTGRMADQLFAYAPGKTALLLTSGTVATLDPIAYAKRSEVMLELGHVGIAEKNAYEQLQKMGPCPFILERLAMIHFIKGNPAAARLFLNALSCDLIFGGRARQLLQQLAKDPELSGHAFVQQGRRRMSDRDNINYRFADGFFQQLLEVDSSNRLAFEYMMAYHLLQGRVHQIAQQIHRLKDFGYSRLPRHYEEALAIYLCTTGEKIDLGPWKPGKEALARIQEFTVQLRNAGGMRNRAAARQALGARFGDTYTFYYTFAAPGEAR